MPQKVYTIKSTEKKIMPMDKNEVIQSHTKPWYLGNSKHKISNKPLKLVFFSP